MKKMGYILFNTDRVEDETGLMKTKRIIGWKTNEELTVLSTFEAEVDLENYKSSFFDMMRKFEEWVENPYERKFITYYQEEIKSFSEEIKLSGYKSRVRDFYKIMSYQFWNIENEMTYRMGFKREEVSFSDLLAVYGLSYIGRQDLPKDKLFNTYALVTHFKTDEKRNKEVFTKPGKQKTSAYETLSFQPIRSTGEELLRQKMEEGWNISIECKAKGRGYGMTYEASAYPLDSDMVSRMGSMRFGVGKTLEELMKNLFTPEELNPYAQKKRKDMEDFAKQMFPAGEY